MRGRRRRRHHSHSHSQEGGIHKPKQTGHDHAELQQDLLKAPQRSRRCCACSGPVPRRNVPRRDGIFCLVRSWVDVFCRVRGPLFFFFFFNNFSLYAVLCVSATKGEFSWLLGRLGCRDGSTNLHTYMVVWQIASFFWLHAVVCIYIHTYPGAGCV